MSTDKHESRRPARWFSLFCGHAAVEHRYHMIVTILAALGVFIIASPAFFFLGRNAGQKTGADSERKRQIDAKATAEETAKRIVGDAERESENVRKSAVVSGKEELIRLRENFESEIRGRREEVEKEERRLSEREGTLDRKYELIDQRDKDLGKRASEFGRREKQVGEREQELEKMVGEERRRLEQLAGLSAQEAKAELIRRMEEE